ncbi:MAG: pyridoxal phosphate-dependent aminotransferase [Halieaceae bacterium]|jgi:arginine:pyruvate transaminase|nr:pyridoxal phosphate-dependent aminotransferase [Halieaceae bacterium]
MKFSRASERLAVDNSVYWGVHNSACALKEAGEDIILFSIGDPDLPTLDFIVDHAVASLKAGRTHYSPGAGERPLRQAIADIESGASGKATSIDQIVVHPGGTNAIFTTLSCFLNEGDEIVIPSPMYVGYQGLLGAIGATVIDVPLDPADNFTLDVDAVKRAFTPATRVLFLNTPGNPGGNIITEVQLRELAAFCLERGVWIVCDEVYSMITFGQRHVSLLKAAGSLENVVVIDALSKSHAMTGWRMGWTVSSRDTARRILDFASGTIFGCCQFVQDAAAFALNNDEEYTRAIADEYRVRRDYAVERIGRIDGLSVNTPQAGMFVMMNVEGVGADGLAFAAGLLEHGGVSVLPGGAFGKISRHFVRLSLTHPVHVMSKAFDRIERYIASLNQ